MGTDFSSLLLFRRWRRQSTLPTEHFPKTFARFSYTPLCEGGTKQAGSIASNPAAFMFLSCVVKTLLQRRLMLPEGEVVFGMLLLRASVQEPRPGFHKNTAGTTSDGTLSNTKSPNGVSLYWEKFDFQMKEENRSNKLHWIPKLTYTGGLLWQSHRALFCQRLCTHTFLSVKLKCYMKMWKH